ncbi:MAG: extracellular solute-binding protein [Agathobacter sp.]|nr:extracellular solute-binding protein [Agathobacter sp.]
MKKRHLGILMLMLVFALLSVKTPVLATETGDERKQNIITVSDEMDADESVYAKTIKYTIKFDGNGATSGKMSAMKSCKYGKSYKLTANKFKRKGYTFIGWNTKKDGSGKAYKNKATVKNLVKKNGKTITLYAQWKKTKYTITYELNGGKNSSKNPSKYYITTKTIKLADPVRTGYTFKGWYSDSKYKNKVTSIKKGSTGNKNFYAKWSENKYNIKFDANGGTGKMATLKSRKYATTYKLTANKFTRSGYKFTGWNTKKDGSGKAYKNKATVKKLTSVNGKTVTLYAQWKKDTTKVTDVTLTVWVSEYQMELLEMQQKEFAAAHPEWNITWVNAPVGEENAKSELLKDIESGADVFFFVNDQLRELVSAGAIAKLDGDVEDMVKETMADSVVDTVKVGDDLYGIPYTHNTFFMYYDKSLLTENDIKSLDTIIAKKTADDVYNFNFDSGGGWKLGAWYYGAGLTVFGEDGDDLDAGCDWNSKTGVAVTKYLIEMINNEKVYMGYSSYDSYELIAEHKLGAWFDGAWSYDSYKQLLGDNLGMAPIPTYGLNGTQVQLKSFYTSKSIGVNAKSDNLEAATAFAEFMGGEEQQLVRYEMTGVVPTNINVGKTKVVQSDELAAVIIEQSNNCSVAQPTSELFGKRYWVHADAIPTNIKNGTLTPETAQEFMDKLVKVMCAE